MLEQRLVELWRVAVLIPGSPLVRPLFVVVEKILAPDEPLPEDWPVHGTVGYELLTLSNGLLVDPAGLRPLSSFYERFSGQSPDFEELAYQCKRLIVRMSMAGELNVLRDRLDRISERNRRTRDFTLSSLTRALQEVIACFSVYRTYVQPDRLLERDVHYIERAVAKAKRRNPAMSSVILDFIRDTLLLRHRDNADDEERQNLEQLAGKFQQLSGPIMAKAVEDTAVTLPATIGEGDSATAISSLRELFTRRTLQFLADSQTGTREFRLADALRTFPVAVWLAGD